MIFVCLFAPFNTQNFKKSLEWIQSFEDTLQESKLAHLLTYF